MRPKILIPALTAAIALSAIPAGALTGSGTIVPEQVPDRIAGIAERVERGALVTTDIAAVAPSAKVIDGDPSDWVGTSAMIAGGSHFDAGELVHTDFVWDAHGADAGEDIDRWNLHGGALYIEERTERLDDLQRTLDMQLGVPYPIGADEMYGNANRDLSVGDITEVRVSADDDMVYLLVRMNTMIDPADVGLVIMSDFDDALGGHFANGQPAETRLGIPEPTRFDHYITVNAGDVYGTSSGVDYAVNAEGYTNAIEVAVPTHFMTGWGQGTMDFTVMSGGVSASGEFVPHNVAFRHAEPIDIYNDRLQAFALHGDAPDGSHLDEFSSGPIDVADLRAGRTQTAVPGPGYHERQFISGENLSAEQGRDGILQPYGLFVPSDFDPSVATPATFWLHYRGGKAHSGATINPRMIHEYAREDLWGPAEVGPLAAGQGNIVVSPHARGTSYWYVGRAHQDFFEVFDDVHQLMGNIDPQRRYLAGYSMGGYGTYLLGLLYPDLFAAGHSVSGAVTQGAWTGVKDSPLCDVREPFSGDGVSPCFIEANSGNADAQLNYRILDNARHYPLHIDHGTDDELVPVTGVESMALRLAELGYRVQMNTFLGYEHFSQAAVDEFADGAAYLQRFTAPVDPRQVTYRVVPALVNAVNTVRADGKTYSFNPDGAYWVDDIVVRDPDITDPRTSALVDVTSRAIAEDLQVPVPQTGAVATGHSTPFVRYGLDWLASPVLAPATGNGFDASLTGVDAVTLDTQRMGLDVTDGVVCGTIDTDGPATLTLAGLGATSGLLFDGATGTIFTSEGPDTVVELPAAGTYDLQLRIGQDTGTC